MKKSLIVALALLAVCLGAALFVWNYAFDKYSYEPVRVEIRAGVAADSIPAIMKDALGKSFGSKVATLWKLQKGTPAGSHGSYLVSPGDDALTVARRIAKGRQTPVRLTFNNLRLVADLASRADAVLELDSAQFITAADTVLSAAGLTPEEFPGAFIPDTYEFYWTASPRSVVERLYAQSVRFWTPERRTKAEALGLTPAQAATLASIVEEESNQAAEWGSIARLYLNRIGKNMKLQADPTVKFALGDFSLRRISMRHTTVDSPYNTYRNLGLPPGPIRIPAAATVDSVLNAPQHKYLYMCAKADFSGRHVFAETYDRHRINAALYHRALDAAGLAF